MAARTTKAVLSQHLKRTGKGIKGCTFEMWVPMRRWMPEHWMHKKTPRFHDAHDGRPTSLQSRESGRESGREREG